MKACEVAALSLSITSSLLAITIEAGILVGGIYIFKKFFQEEKPENVEHRPKWNKIKRITKAVLED